MNSHKRIRDSSSNILSSIEEIRKAYQAKRISLEALKAARLEAQSQIKTLNEKHDIGRKFLAVGLALIICPEPIFSNLIGTPLLILGKIINRIYHPSTIADLMNELRSNLDDLKEII
ncbi:MAG: hypothetical protein QW372_06940 [Nitrososphaerales archaeon]